MLALLADWCGKAERVDGWAIGADIATMLTAAIVWTRTQWDQRQEHRAQTRLRNWHGYIDVGGIDTWYVRLADDPKTPTAEGRAGGHRPPGQPGRDSSI